jgi:2-dehydropantoate 2-reductase
MNTIHKVYLSGLGAIGSAFASRIHDTDPDSIRIIASQERIRRYMDRGITVNGKPYFFQYVRPDENEGPADLILIAVKQHHLQQAISDIRNFVGRDTIILSLLNGITSEDIIGREYGMEKLLYSFCVGIDAVREGTDTRYSKLGQIVFGDKANNAYSPNAAAVKYFFEKAHIPYSIPGNIMRELWWKFMINVGMNQVSAVLRAPYRVFQNISEARELVESAFNEVIALSAKTGINLDSDDIKKCFEIVNTLSPEGKTSMLQDVEAGRKTEVEIFAGTIIELGLKYNVQTPVNDMLFKMIRVLEQSNAGK